MNSRPEADRRLPDRPARLAALEAMILSASGWRKVFAAGGEEDPSPGLAPADRALAAAAAAAFARFLAGRAGGRAPVIALGSDTRPTGPAIAAEMMRTLLGLGLPVRFLSAVAVPEFLAWVRGPGRADGFAYISASHNPIGHNGFKFGLADGSVLAGGLAAGLIAEYRRLVADDERMAAAFAAAEAAEPGALAAVYGRAAELKAQAAADYRDFVLATASGGAGEPAEKLRRELSASIARRGLGLVADMNGSARCLSIDRGLLESLGARVVILNGRPGRVAHAIIPEGEALEPCRAELERAAAADPAFRLGYVPDNDGDRGNLVYWDASRRRAAVIESQQVFALACAAELAWLEWSGSLGPGARCAVVVNDPTSLRIERIAAAFGARVERVEVGEANVVNRARELREQGWLVRVLGEGSNGGTIIHPAAVRDPLNTLFGFIKLLYLPGLFAIWLARSAAAEGRDPPSAPREAAELAEVLASLPVFSTTGVAEPEAVMRIRTIDHAALKAAYERLFLEDWRRRRTELERFGIAGWEERNYEGPLERRGFGPAFRSGAQRGGFKILFTDASGRECAFMWMRGSGTEPVFRVLVDSEGPDQRRKKYLLAWHRDLIARADQEASV